MAITLHGYRSRWRSEPLDPRYHGIREATAATAALDVPTLMIQGGADACDPPRESEGQARYFTGEYRRVVIEDAGHFPAREAPAEVSALLEEHLRHTAQH